MSSTAVNLLEYSTRNSVSKKFSLVRCHIEVVFSAQNAIQRDESSTRDSREERGLPNAHRASSKDDPSASERYVVSSRLRHRWSHAVRRRRRHRRRRHTRLRHATHSQKRAIQISILDCLSFIAPHIYLTTNVDYSIVLLRIGIERYTEESCAFAILHSTAAAHAWCISDNTWKERIPTLL